MHWAGQLVSNFAYSRYDDVAPMVKSKLSLLEAELFDQVRHTDALLNAMDDEKAASELATQFSFSTAESLHKTWVDFHGEVFARFVDGYTTEIDETDEFCGCKKTLPHWPGTWRNLIASNTGDRYAWRNADPRTEATLYNEGANGIAPKRDVAEHHPKPRAAREVIDKLSLAAVGGHVQGKGVASFEIEADRYSHHDLVPNSGDLQLGSQAPWRNHITMAAVLLLTNCVSIGLGFWIRSTMETRNRTNLISVAPLLH